MDPSATQTVEIIETLDLRLHQVLAHFAKRANDVALFNFLLKLDRVDRWSIDHDETQAEQTVDIQWYLQQVENFVKDNVAVLHHITKEFLVLLAYLRTSRCLYLIQYVVQNNDQFLESLGQVLQDDKSLTLPCSAVKKRLDIVNKGELLGRIFSGKRLQRIVDIMGVYTDAS